MSVEKMKSLAKTLAYDLGRCTHLMWPIALVAVSAFSILVLGRRFLPAPGVGNGLWDLSALAAIAVTALAIVWPYMRRPHAIISRYCDFVSQLDGTRIDEVLAGPGTGGLKALGEALNRASRRLYKQRLDLVRQSEQFQQLAELVEESPFVVLTIDQFGDIQYLNARAQQVVSVLGLAREDISLLLPRPVMALVEGCIGHQETLTDLEVSYNDHTLYWTVKPLRGKPLLQAQASVTVRNRHYHYRPSADSRRTDREAGTPPMLYAINKHPDYRRQRGTILVIDDDPMVHDLMSSYFTREGYTVNCADGGDAGLELAATLKPDLITLDIMMPGKNGWIVLSALKDNPELAHIPVVIVSGVGNARFVHAMGADDFLPKPVDWDELGRIVERLSPRFRSVRVAP